MPLQPVILERFGGLNLRSDAAEVGATAAVDMVNVMLDRDGRARFRDGFASYTSGTTTDARHGYMFLPPDPTEHQFLCQYGTNSAGKVAAFNDNSLTTPLDTATFVDGTAAITGYQAIGTPAETSTFITTSSREVFKWNGSAFSTVTQTGRLAGLSPQDNRLVLADTDTNEESFVRFSDPGDPETFDPNNYVQLTPGDGEDFIAVATWREFVFVFKETRFFVFYGNDTDTAGKPVFNYRPVDGFGAIGNTGNQAVAVGKDGVYFTARDGVYRTSGGQPQRISDPIGPWFDQTTGPYFSGKATFSTNWAFMAVVGDRLYLILFPTFPASGYLMWALDTRTGDWEYWEPQLGGELIDGLGLLRSTSSGGAPALAVSTLAAIRILKPGTTSDASAYTSRYRTGFLDFGDPNPKSLKQVLLDGTGTVTVGCAVDSATSVPAGTSVTLGSSPAISRGRYPKTHAGHNFSLQYTFAAGASLSRAVPMIESAKQPGEEN